MIYKKLFLFCFAVAISAMTLKAQVEDPGPGTVVVYSENGDKFTLYLNGGQMNASPMSRVVVENFKEVPVSFRMVFEDGSPELTKKGLRQGKYCLYSIVKDKKGNALKMKGCSMDPPADPAGTSTQSPVTTSAASTPDQLSAKFVDGMIVINDGRTIAVKKVQANGMTYPRVIMTALPGAKVSITYDDNSESYSAESPLKYEVKDFQLNNAYFTLTVDEGGPARTWHVKLQNANGYDLKID
ncbi:MAG: hypothetical protein HOP08_03635 [Cyclobacteriaceae bacterium]|nr:hypothetical protein [Cyclobacteriaceae bacterium]